MKRCTTAAGVVGLFTLLLGACALPNEDGESLPPLSTIDLAVPGEQPSPTTPPTVPTESAPASPSSTLAPATSTAVATSTTTTVAATTSTTATSTTTHTSSTTIASTTTSPPLLTTTTRPPFSESPVNLSLTDAVAVVINGERVTHNTACLQNLTVLLDGVVEPIAAGVGNYRIEFDPAAADFKASLRLAGGSGTIKTFSNEFNGVWTYEVPPGTKGAISSGLVIIEHDSLRPCGGG